MSIPDTFYPAIAVFLSGLIAGYFNYANTINSKEAKISEFRQAWIDALRQEVSAYISSVRTLATSLEAYKKKCHDINLTEVCEERASPLIKINELSSEQRANFINDNKDLYQTITENYHKIQLRINPEETAQGKLYYDFMFSVNSSYQNSHLEEIDLMLNDLESIVKHGAVALKFEWERVKEGEPSYASLKKNSPYVFGISGFLFACIFFASANNTTAKKIEPTSLTLLYNEVIEYHKQCSGAFINAHNEVSKVISLYNKDTPKNEITPLEKPIENKNAK